MQATAPQNHSLFPNDLQGTTRILSNVIGVVENTNLTVDDVVSQKHLLKMCCYCVTFLISDT